MGRLRRTSKVLEKAQLRAAGIKAVDPALDLGTGLTLASFDANINTLVAKLAAYNQMLASLDDLYNQLLTDEKALSDLSERMLAGVGARFGKNSSQYEQAGGVRKSERKSRSQGSKTKPATT
jgi:hypothetical protein